MSIKYLDKSQSTPSEVLLAGISPVDQILNGISKNAISNKAVYNALAEKIEVTVENLTNFYNKSQTYNKTEVRALVDAISTMTIEVVNSLPTQDISTTTIYFLKQSGTNVYDQYVYVNNAWVKIGDTQIDLSGYMTTADFNIAIADYYDKSAIDTMIANYYTKAQVDDLLQNIEIDVDSALSNSSENPVQNKVITAVLDGKQGLVFTGTQAEWDALSVAQKTSYTFCNITDDTDYVGNIVDAVTDGDMSAVTSNAVYNVTNEINTNLGNKSSASAVSGNDAFSKINTLNNKSDFGSAVIKASQFIATSGYIKTDDTNGVKVTNEAGNNWKSILVSDVLVSGGTKSVLSYLPKTYSGTATTDNDGWFTISSEVLRPTTGVMIGATVILTSNVLASVTFVNSVYNVYSIRCFYSDMATSVANQSVSYTIAWI